MWNLLFGDEEDEDNLDSNLQEVETNLKDSMPPSDPAPAAQNEVSKESSSKTFQDETKSKLRSFQTRFD